MSQILFQEQLSAGRVDIIHLNNKQTGKLNVTTSSRMPTGHVRYGLEIFLVFIMVHITLKSYRQEIQNIIYSFSIMVIVLMMAVGWVDNYKKGIV